MIFRVNKTKGFSVISNYHLQDKNLSLRAKGLLSLMLSLPDDWKFSIPGLASLCIEKEQAVKSSLDELKAAGYVVVTKLLPNQTASKRIEWLYDVYEKPQTEDLEEEQSPVEQPPVKQGVDTQGVVEQGIGSQGSVTRVAFKNSDRDRIEFIKDIPYLIFEVQPTISTMELTCRPEDLKKFGGNNT